MEREVARRLNVIKKETIDCMMKELKIETLKRQSLAENESSSTYANYFKMHPRK